MVLWNLFPAPSWQLRTIYDSSSRESSLASAGTVHTCTGMQTGNVPIHIKTIKYLLKNVMENPGDGGIHF